MGPEGALLFLKDAHGQTISQSERFSPELR